MSDNNNARITIRFNQEEMARLKELLGEVSSSSIKERLFMSDNLSDKQTKPAPKMQHQFAGYTFVGHFPDEQNASGMLAVVRNKFGRESTFESGSPEYQSLVNADYEPYFKPGEVIQ